MLACSLYGAVYVEVEGIVVLVRQHGPAVFLVSLDFCCQGPNASMEVID